LAFARYKALSAIRRRSDEHLDDDVLTMIEDPAEDPETLVQKKDRSAIVQNCLAQLLAARDDDIVTSEHAVRASGPVHGKAGPNHCLA
jgi:DNA-directed RNA polymerase specialized sigma24 family protein